MKKIAILQSNYIPWRGYFDIIHDVDLFIFYDEAQFTKNDWRNRNRIYSNQGLNWISLPCGSDISRKINEVKLSADTPWAKQQWEKIKNAYMKAPYFNQYKDFFYNCYFEKEWEYLSHLNQYLIKEISQSFLGIKTIFDDSLNYESHGVKGEKLLSLLISSGCTVYVSGPAAKDYIVEDDYKQAGIDIIWKDYSGYPEYPQRNTPFEPNVSIIDLLFNVGPDVPYYIWGWRGNK
jgi:hypothetical protein